MKTNHFDSGIYISIRWLAFCSASAVSALLNLFLFSSLDASYTWLLISMSLTLEMTKISTVITRNCFASIYEKVRKVSIKAKQHMFMFFYLLLAMLSVTAGLGFSITITARTAATQSISLATMQAQYQTLTEQLEKISTKQLEISELNKSTGVSIDSYEPFTQANQRYQEAEAAYILANNNYRAAVAGRSGLVEGTVEFNTAQTEVNRTNQMLSGATTARSLTKTEADRIKANFNDFQMNSETVATRLNDELHILNEELSMLISQVGLSTEIGSVALLELDNKIREEENRNIIEKGMAFMFEEFAKYLHTTPELVKLFILLFVAILIELTIWQCSPDIRISRRVLYFFRNSIPPDTNIKEILEKFDEENRQFEDIAAGPIITEPEPIEPPESPPPSPPKKKKPRKVKPKRLIEDLVVTEQEPPIIEEAVKEMKEKTPTAWPLNPPDPIVWGTSEATKELDTHYVDTTSVEDLVIPSVDMTATPVDPNPDTKYRYRFGRTTRRIASMLVEFVLKCIGDEGEFLMDPAHAALELHFNDRVRDVFLGHLSNIKWGNKSLISQDESGNYWANFSSDEIIKYATEIIGD
jgi:hypothetical protein